MILASRFSLIGDEDVAEALLRRVDLREEEELVFLLFYTKRYVGRAGLELLGFGWALSGCCGAAAGLLLGCSTAR
jgi:hypothetical protein